MTWYVTGIANTPQGRVVGLKNSAGQTNRMPETQLIQAVVGRQIELANAGVSNNKIVPMNRTAPVARQKGNKLSTYSVIGRYMNGRNVLGYQIQNDATGAQHKVSRPKLIELCQKGQMTNCRVQKDPTRVAAGEAPRESCMLIRGIDINMNTLPIFDEKDGVMKRTENLGTAKMHGTTPQSAFGRLRITGKLVCGRDTIGFVVSNAGGVSKRLRKDQVVQLIQQKQIGNARVQMDRGTLLVRGIGDDFNNIPKIQVDAHGNDIDPKSAVKAQTQARPGVQSAASQATKSVAQTPKSVAQAPKSELNRGEVSITHIQPLASRIAMKPARNCQSIPDFLRGINNNVWLGNLANSSGKLEMISQDTSGVKYHYLVKPWLVKGKSTGIKLDIICSQLPPGITNVMQASSAAPTFIRENNTVVRNMVFTGVDINTVSKMTIIAAAMSAATLLHKHGGISQVSVSHARQSVAAAVQLKASDIKTIIPYIKVA